jgi:hypothetical protein
MLDLVELLEWLNNAGVVLVPATVTEKFSNVKCEYKKHPTEGGTVTISIESKPGAIIWPEGVKDCLIEWTADA